ncbi:hypothetical protein [uncultured Pantoea sp.]|uniref:hypothetical protein n=1 Tax=uncultured Pantoea sp. TaxID=218084 RepID=UPI0025DB3220|nr:hypothetical protein [uncultured Pantoea sp.]
MLVHFWLQQFEKKKHDSDRIILNYDVSIKYDFYSVRFTAGENNEHLYSFKGFSGGKIQALQYDGSAFTNFTELTLEDVKQENFSVRHYYRANEFIYSSLKDLTLKNNFHKIVTVSGNAHRSYAQYRFNKQTLFMKDRLEILSIVLDEFFSNDKPHGLSSISVMNAIYTSKWLFHPDSTNFHNRIRFYLNSLVASGDLKLDGMGNYIAQPKALETLEKYRQESKREHRDSKLKSWTLFWSILAVIFTFFSAWGTLVQAGILPKWVF